MAKKKIPKLRSIRKDLEDIVPTQSRAREDMHAWLAFVEYVDVSHWWGSSYEINLAWSFFLCGWNEDKED